MLSIVVNYHYYISNGTKRALALSSKHSIAHTIKTYHKFRRPCYSEPNQLSNREIDRLSLINYPCGSLILDLQ